MVSSVYHRLRADIERDTDEVERAALMPWFMAFASGHRLSLYHPRMGAINYSGISFWGSPALVFDRFARLSIDDLLEKHVRAAEDALERVPAAQFAQVVDECVELLRSADLQLSEKARTLKARLMQANPQGSGRVNPIPRTEQTSSVMRYRLDAKVDEVRLLRAEAQQHHAPNVINVGENHGAIQQGAVNSRQSFQPREGDE